MTLCIIFACLFVISLILLIICTLADWHDWMFTTLCILLFVSGIGTVISAVFVERDVKSREYPTSDYDFKIKVVEFEEHRDTILVVIPKERIIN